MWLRQTSVKNARAMLAAYAGYGLDGFDFMIYTFIIPTLIALWGMSKAQAGYIASASLITSAIGGWAAGVLADRYGRVRILQLTVLWFAVFTCLSGFTHSFGELLFTRAMQGFGFGGEWCVGSVLVAEIIEARHRGKAAGSCKAAGRWAGPPRRSRSGRASALLPPETGLGGSVLGGHSPGAAGHLHSPQSAGAGDLRGIARAGRRARRAAGARAISWIFFGRRCCAPPSWPRCCRPECSPPITRSRPGCRRFWQTERHLSVADTHRLLADDDRRFAGGVSDQRLAVGCDGAPARIHAVRLRRERC